MEGNGRYFEVKLSSAVESVAMPLLEGERTERLFGGLKEARTTGPFRLFNNDRWTLGRAVVSTDGRIERTARTVYQSLGDAVGARHLCRIWNYVPRINELESDGLEGYRAFCRARHEALNQLYGRAFSNRLPAASAVGVKDDFLTVIFAACAVPPRHFENPDQVPAYEYPEDYGPKPPSFSRATVVPGYTGTRDVFISGTSSVKGHETVAPGDTARQIKQTLDNLAKISAACGLQATLGNACGDRWIKVYLRNDYDLALARSSLEGRLIRAGDRVSYLQADICRADLNVEIEATLLGVT